MKKLFPRIQDIFFISLFISVALQGPDLLNEDGDLGRHITIGKYILNHWTIPTRDIFSHTMTGERLVPHEWLAQLIFGGLHAIAGLSGDVLLVALLIATTFSMSYRAIQQRNVFRIVAFLVAALAAYTSSIHWLARPHIFTFMFVALWSYQLENKSSKIWLFPLIMLIWANTHGAFIFGFIILAAHLAGWFLDFTQKREAKATGIKLGIIGITSFGATFINPSGWHLWDVSMGYMRSRFLIDQTVEYQSPNFHIWSMWPFLIMLILFLLGLGFGGKLKAHEAFLLAGWTALSLYNARNIPIFAIITAPYIGQLIQSVIEKSQALQKTDQNIANLEQGMNGIVFNALAITIMLFATQPNPADQFNPKVFPVDAVNWLEQNPQEGKMFNYFTWGGYILYRMWPEQTVFIDGQTDFYGENLTRNYESILKGSPNWDKDLRTYNVNWIIVPNKSGLANAVQFDSNWQVVYKDNLTIIFSRK